MKNLLTKWAGPLLAVPLLYSAAVPLAHAAAPTLVAFWDFNTATDAAKTVDKVYGFEGTLENGAAFTPAGEGRTSTGTDRAMDFGPDSSKQLVRISKVPFLNFAAANDQITISFWEKLTDVANSSAFWGVSPSSNNGERGIQAHVPWSDNNIYFDHAGCCDAGIQRINKVLPDGYDVTIWHHLVFVKNGAVKQIWIDGVLFLEGAGTAPLPKDFTRLMLGSDNAGGNSLHGVEDDFAVYAGALTPAMITALASGTAPDKVPGTVVSTGPLLGGAIGNPGGFSLDITEPPGSPIQASTLSLTLDGTAVTATSVSKAGNSTAVRYDLPAGTFFPPGSTHMVQVSVKDAGGATIANSSSFTVVSYGTIPATAKVTPDTSKPGFLWRIFANSANQANNTQRIEDALAGLLKDADGNPLPNNADPNAQGAAIATTTAPSPANAPITFEIATVINLSQTEGENNGSFPNDEQMPGVPQTDGSTDGMAAEIITYLELPAGPITMGIYSDDGFKTTAVNPQDAFGAVTLKDTAGACCAEVLFNLAVQEAGVYAFRTAYEEGGGGANIEWYTVKADGTKVLVGDTANGGLKAYRARLGGTDPYIKSVTPSPAPRQVNVVSSSLSMVLSDGNPKKIDDNSIVLKFDGATVTPTKTRTGGLVTVTYAPAGLQIPTDRHTAEISFKDTTGTFTRDQTWTFYNLKNLVLPTPKVTENFDSYAEDTQPTGWVFWNYTSHCSDGRDITSQTSESYEDWVLVSVDNAPLIDGNVLNIAPGQIFNGKPVDSISSGNILYAESDSRCNTDALGRPYSGQTQFIISSPFNLSTLTNVILSFSALYEQNQDSYGGVEYSIDGGTNWFPVVYYLDTPDIVLNADGTVNAVATFTAPNSDTSTWTIDGTKYGAGAHGYGDGVGAAITQDLALYIAPRINDDAFEGARIEAYRLPKASLQKDVRLRFSAMGTDSWWFAVDNIAFYDIGGAPPVTEQPKFNTVTLQAGVLNVSWTGSGTLQQATAVNGSWTAAPSQANPQAVQATGPAKFFRLISQ